MVPAGSRLDEGPATSSPAPDRARRPARFVLGIAVAVFVAQGVALSDRLPLWSEQTSTVVGPPFDVLDASSDDRGGPLSIRPGCPEGLRVTRSDTRPVAALCAAGLAWPILVSPYASGVVYWPLALLRPLGGAGPVAQRVAGLIFGVLGIAVLFLLVEHLSGSRRAAASALVASVLSPYVIEGTLLVHYETVPPLLVLAAALVLVRAPPSEPSLRRMWLVGGLTGLAVVSNVKMLVVLGVLALVARFARLDVPRPSRRGAAHAAVAAACLIVPSWVMASTDPYGGVSAQFVSRFGTMLSHLSPAYLLAELANVLVFAVDFVSYLDIAAGGDGDIVPALSWVALVGLIGATRALVARVRGGPGDPSAAAAAALTLAYVVFVALAYDQSPPANYGPIVHALAVLVAIPFVEIGEGVAQRLGRAGEPASVVVAVLVAVASLAVATHRRGDVTELFPMSIDLHAERTVARWLDEHDDGTPVLTTIYNHAGVFDALAPTSRPSIAAHRYLHRCDEREAEGSRACVAARFRLLLGDPGRLPLRFVVPLRAARVDERGAPHLLDAVHDAAADLGLSVREEARGVTTLGIDVLAVLRVEAAASALGAESSSRAPALARGILAGMRLLPDLRAHPSAPGVADPSRRRPTLCAR